jgi:oligopeptide/dipeptide ABC transporter ATP-binding protein
MTRAILQVNNLHVSFKTREGLARVVTGVNLTLAERSVLGLVGESGCGKSVLCSAVLNLVRRPGRIVKGEVLYKGRDLLRSPESELQRLRGSEVAMILPHPHTALNPMLCVGDQIANMWRAHHDASRLEARRKALEAIAAVGINDPERRYAAYPHELSGGMAQRIIIAIGLLCSPFVLIADEPTSGLDVTIAAQVLDMMAGLIEKEDASTLIATRDLAIVAQYCHNIAVMCAGQIVEQAPVETFFENAAHPYSRLLLAAAMFDSEAADRISRSRNPPDKYNLPPGCPFSERCSLVNERCTLERPPLRALSAYHSVACFSPMGGFDG